MLHLWFAKIDNLTEVPIYFITNFSVFQKNNSTFATVMPWWRNW
ncbi:MAG: hypothetical protein ACPHVL_02285 [Psychroflexus salarius]